MTRRRSQIGPGRIVVALLALAAALPGCAQVKAWRGDPLAISQKTPCRLPPNPTADELVAAVNENVDRLQAWHASRVKIRAAQIPFALEAELAVQKGRHLRLIVAHSLGGGPELDLGCNDKIFWFWQRRQKPPAVMYASHEQLEVVRDNLQIPFEPDWLMEALGVAPIEAEEVILEPISDQRAARLVSQHVAPNGRQIRKTITVDTCHGRVLNHAVWDAETGQRLAYAEFSQHKLDPASGVIMPRRIELEWRQTDPSVSADLSLTLDLGEVEVNPTGLPQRIWEMPHPPGCPTMNLAEFAGSPQPYPVPAARRSAALADEQADGDPDGEFWQPRRSTELDADEPIDYEAQ
jgi:hypothetical protein